MANSQMILFTDAIGGDSRLDPRYTCDIDNSSPELRWEQVPRETEGFALVAEDLDSMSNSAPFTHWLIYNIPKSIHHLPAGIPPQETLPNGIKQGINSLGKLGYSGPCPPFGSRSHRYVFRLFALRHLPQVPQRIRREELFIAIQPFIITSAEVLGYYERIIQRAG